MDQISEIEIEAIVLFVSRGVEYEGRIGRILRTISEAIHCDRYYGGKTRKGYYDSSNAKKINPIISRQAASLLETMTFDEFRKVVDLEHPLPLKEAYRSLCDAGTDITREHVIACLGRYPLVTVTKEEHRRLKNFADPIERYRLANVEVGCVEFIRFGVKAHSWKPVSLTARSSSAI